MNKNTQTDQLTLERSGEDRETFEQAFARLETLCERMSSPDIALEDSIELYTQGVRLVDYCQKSLEAAQLKVETLAAGGARESGIAGGRAAPGEEAQ